MATIRTGRGLRFGATTRSRRRFVAGLTAGMLLVGHAAFADQTSGDVAGTGTGSVDVQAGEAYSVDVDLVVRRTGQAAGVVTWSVDSRTCPAPTFTGNPIDLTTLTSPTWAATANTTLSSARGKVAVATIAGTAGASGSCQVVFRATDSAGNISGGNQLVTVTVNYVAGATNTAPTTPGAPTLTAGVTPNSTGEFTLSWDASTDAEGDPVTYTLQHRNAAGAGFTDVASGLTTNSYTFDAAGPEGEGTWAYRVQASDGSLSSAFSSDSAAVVVDRTAPNAPVAQATTVPDYMDGADSWWKGSVTVSFAPDGDPDLADGSAGSGVDPATVSGDQTFSTTGEHVASGTVKDNAGNESAPGTLTVHVDATAPTASFDACPSSVPFNSTPPSIGWTAGDVGSGLATADSGVVDLDTSEVGTRTVPGPAPQDNVGNIGTAPSCTYSVVYASTGILQPINLDGSSVFKINSTIPVKVKLTGDSAGYGGGVFTISLVRLGAAATGEVNETPVSTSAHSGTTLRYDATGDLYIFNLGTKGLTAGAYRVTVALDDGTTRTAEFTLRK